MALVLIDFSLLTEDYAPVPRYFIFDFSYSLYLLLQLSYSSFKSAYLDTNYHKEFDICDKSLSNLMKRFFVFTSLFCVFLFQSMCWSINRAMLVGSAAEFERL
jgi:hypothetical protein